MGCMTFFRFLHRCFLKDAEGYTPPRELTRKTEKRLRKCREGGASRDGPPDSQEREARN